VVASQGKVGMLLLGLHVSCAVPIMTTAAE
jgi:hypothetical protein